MTQIWPKCWNLSRYLWQRGTHTYDILQDVMLPNDSIFQGLFNDIWQSAIWFIYPGLKCSTKLMRPIFRQFFSRIWAYQRPKTETPDWTLKWNWGWYNLKLNHQKTSFYTFLHIPKSKYHSLFNIWGAPGALHDMRSLPVWGAILLKSWHFVWRFHIREAIAP